jgi:hypothetical protein
MGSPDTPNSYDHAFTLAFSMPSATEDGTDISGAQFRAALHRRIADLPDDELANAVSPPLDTIRNHADGTLTHTHSVPLYSHLEMEAALCVWEFMEAASNRDDRLCIAALADLRDRIGSAELRHASIPIGQYCLKVYDLIPEDARGGHAYDWEIIPAIVATIEFPSLEPTLSPAEAAQRVTAELLAPPPAPPAPEIPPVPDTVAEAEDDEEPTVASEFDICCPGCGSDEHMQVLIAAYVKLSTEGAITDGEHGWDSESPIHCNDCGWLGHVRDCRADAIAAAKADAVSKPSKRIMAEFIPQAWLNDHAIAVDPQGDTMFDVTDHILKIGRASALCFEDGTLDTDNLRQLPSSPQWVKDWTGPFTVNVQEAIAAYFTAHACTTPIIPPRCTDGGNTHE